MKLKVAFVAPRGAEPKADPSGTEPTTSTPTAEINAPHSAEIAAQLLVEWKGAGNQDDFISVTRPEQPPGASLNRTRVREGSPLKLWMPSEPGEYELRYVLGRGSKVLAKSAITITAVPAQVQPDGPVNVAAWIEVKWQGPARDGDYICVVRRDQKPGTQLSMTPVRAGNPLKVRAPSDPGEYEVRYLLARGARSLAQASLTVNPVTAEVHAPGAVAVGAEFQVQWQGPGYPEDLVALARADQPPGSSVSFAPVRQGNPVKLRAPKEPGTYELRYILGYGKRQLAKTTITIQAP
jgi:Ca-activated chloride channel family protein